MAFILKKISNNQEINVIQLGTEYYAKIDHQPFDKYIVVCKISFKTVDENTIKDITIYNPSGRISDIIGEFNFLDTDGNDTLSKELKQNLIRSVYYSQYESSKLPYFNNIGFCFGYH